jgi:hypothetical protein
MVSDSGKLVLLVLSVTCPGSGATGVPPLCWIGGVRGEHHLIHHGLIRKYSPAKPGALVLEPLKAGLPVLLQFGDAEYLPPIAPITKALWCRRQNFLQAQFL